MDITKNIVIQAVVFTDNEKGACKKTGLGMNIANGEIIEYTKISETIPYGRLFLTELNSILLNPEIWIDNDSFIEIKLITGQPNLNNVGKNSGGLRPTELARGGSKGPSQGPLLSSRAMGGMWRISR